MEYQYKTNAISLSACNLMYYVDQNLNCRSHAIPDMRTCNTTYAPQITNCTSTLETLVLLSKIVYILLIGTSFLFLRIVYILLIGPLFLFLRMVYISNKFELQIVTYFTLLLPYHAHLNKSATDITF